MSSDKSIGVYFPSSSVNWSLSRGNVFRHAFSSEQQWRHDSNGVWCSVSIRPPARSRITLELDRWYRWVLKCGVSRFKLLEDRGKNHKQQEVFAV